MSQNINVDVDTLYIESESSPANSQYVFAYTITITNEGTEAAKLMTRHWVITDANGHVEEVHGDGVVGEQPLVLAAGVVADHGDRQWQQFRCRNPGIHPVQPPHTALIHNLMQV